MADQKVTCKTLSGGSTYKHIVRIGVQGGSYEVSEAIRAIENHVQSFLTVRSEHVRS